MLSSESKVLNIYQAINKIMEDLPAIPKSRTLEINGRKVYNFRGVDDIYAALQPLLIKHGVITLPKAKLVHQEKLETTKTDYKTKEIKTSITNRVVLEVEYIFVGPDGSEMFSRVVSEGMDTGDKACNKAMSAAHKYVLLQAFCIPTEEAKDSENEHHETKKSLPLPPQQTEKKSPSVLAHRAVTTGNTSTASTNKPAETVDQQLSRLKNQYQPKPGPKMPTPYKDDDPGPESP